MIDLGWMIEMMNKQWFIQIKLIILISIIDRMSMIMFDQIMKSLKWTFTYDITLSIRG